MPITTQMTEHLVANQCSGDPYLILCSNSPAPKPAPPCKASERLQRQGGPAWNKATEQNHGVTAQSCLLQHRCIETAVEATNNKAVHTDRCCYGAHHLHSCLRSSYKPLPNAGYNTPLPTTHFGMSMFAPSMDSRALVSGKINNGPRP
jgi:hypothetical protein